MENEKQNTNIPVGGDGVKSEPPAGPLGLISDLDSMQVLSMDPGEPEAMNSPPEVRRRNIVSILKRADVALVVLLILFMVGLIVWSSLKKETPRQSANNVSRQFSTVQIPLEGFVATTQGLGVGLANSVVINGSLKVGDGLVIAPSVQPNAPKAGQLYYDQNTNQLAYFNGQQYIALTEQGAVVQSLGGLSGSITLGGGLSVVGNQLTVTFPDAPAGVSSLGGATGELTVGTGLRLADGDLQNAGVLSLTSGSGNLVVGTDGSGNLTITDTTGPAGTGTVTSSGGTTGRIAKFTGVQNIEDSLLSESGALVTVNGSLAVTGTLSLSSPLSVASGGTGASAITTNGVVIGQGTGSLATVTAAGTGLCLMSTAGAPAFQACPGGGGGGVTSLNGLTGGLSLANASGSGSTVTIDNASVAAKGLAQFNAANFSVAAGVVNTIQDISATATPTFAGLNTNSINPSGTLTIGSLSQSFTVQGTASSVFTVSGGGFSTNVGFSGTPVGNVTYNFDRTPTGGSYNICTTAANCAGVGGGVTTAGGTTNRLSKFLGSQSLGDSLLSDDGTNITVNGTANLVVQGGTATLGTLTQAGRVVLHDGGGNTATLLISGLAANRTYTIPDAGGPATFCLSTGNCIGGGSGGAPNNAAYLLASLDGTLSNERALGAGSNLSLSDGGANGTLSVATVMNPSFTTSVTTPLLQSSGALTISSAAGQTVVVDAGTTIQLQDDTNVTGNFDVSGGLNAGTGNAFQISSAGAITAAAGITSSGTITFSGLNCTGNANGGALTTNGSGQLVCSDDDGGSGSAITGSGSAGTVPLFNGTQTITNSIITQSGTTINIAGDLTLNTDLSVANGGTGAGSFLANGLVYGNGTGALQVTAAGTGGQVMIANASGVPTFMSVSGDVSVSNTGVATIQANSIALGTDTTGNYVDSLGALTGLTTSGNTGEGSTPTLSVTYGAIANTAVQGNVTLTCPSGTGNLSGGGGSITLGSGGSCGNLTTVNNPTFSTSVTTPSLILTGTGSNGTIQVGNLGQGTVYTLPDPVGATATICISTGNCASAGTAGGDLTGTYPNPTIAKLQNTNLSITSPTAGQVLVYNGTNSAWENRAITGDLAISETGTATVQANSVALGTDTTGNYVVGLAAGNGINISGSAGEAWSPTVAVLYGASANTAVEGNTSLTVSAGTNLTGGGGVTLGTGGTLTLNVANSPTFSGTLTVQGATATVGTAAQQGSVVLSDGSSNTGTVQTAALGQNTIYTLPDPSSGTATICLNTGNCAGSGSGVTTTGGTTDRLSKFTNSQALGDSSISDSGGVVTLNGTANLVVQGGTSTLGTVSQAGTLDISDGSSNAVSIVVTALAANRTYTLPDAGGPATFCLSTGNCLGGGAGGAPNNAAYLLASLDGTLTNERALNSGSNISFTDAGANGNFTVATVMNPSFTTSVTTPILQSSGALSISSAAGQTVAIDAGTTIELQDSTNVTGSLDVSVALNVGTANAFAVSSGGAITAAAGITSSGTITFSGLNCTGNANGGALTTNGSGQLVCSDDDGGSGSAITGSGASGTVALFTGAQTIGNSIVTQSGTTITIAGDLLLNTDLTVANGGTGASSFTGNGVLYGNGSSALQVTAAGTSGQVLVADGSGVPTFVSFSGDVTVSSTGATTIQANSVALGTDTTGNYVGTLGTLTGLTTSGNTGEGSTPTLSVSYGSGANTAVQGNTTLTCPSGTGNLTGGGTSITLGTGGTCGNISTVNNPTFSTSVTTPSLILTGAGSNGTLQVANLGQATTYTLPDPVGASAIICLDTGNCASAGTAGGDLTGTYPNPTIAKLQNTNLTITTPTAGQVLVYNGTSTRWENRSISSDIAISETGVATIQANSVALGTDTTGNYVLGLTAGNGISISGTPGEGWSPTVTALYGSTANTAVEGNTSITVTAGTNLTGGGSITLGSGGTVTLNVASSPTFTGSLTVQGTGANTFSGQLVVSNVATDITTGTNEDLTAVANGTGQIVLNDTVQIATLGAASNVTYLCRNGSNQIATCSSGASGSAFVQGGNTFSAAGDLGTNDSNDLNLRTNSTTRLTIKNDGSQLTVASNTDFILQGATAYISNAQGQTGAEAFGLTAAATGTNALAVGNASSAAAGGVAVGQAAVAVTDGVAIGNAAGVSSGAFGGPVSVGDDAVAESWGVAIGGAATTTGNWGVAVGQSTTAGQRAVALGQDATANTNGVALGANSSTGGNNRIVIGYSATATADNQLVVGANTTAGSYISDAYFGSGVTDATPQNVTLNATGGSGADIAGASINIAGGRGTGTGNGGSINLRIAKPAGGTSSVLNALSTVFSLSGTNGSALLQNATDSAAALQVQNAAATEVLFKVDTTARSASGGNLIKIGNSTGTDTALTILQLDSASANPTSNLAALNGGLFYNSNTNKVSIVENGAVKVLCNTTDLGCGAGGSGLAKNAVDTSTATVAASSYLYSFTNDNTAASGGVLLLNNGANTGSGIRVNATANTVAGTSALFFGQLTNSSVSGNLLDLKSGASGSEASKITVSSTGATTLTANAGSNGTNGGNGISVLNATAGAGGTGSTGSGGIGGGVQILTGLGGNGVTAGGNGGNMILTAQNGGTASGAAATAGTGGKVFINAGTGGTNASGIAGGGGDISLQAGNSGATGTANTGGNILLQAGTSSTLANNGRVQVGSSTTDANGNVLTLDSYNGASEASFGAGQNINGSMYYNSNLNKFRCYQNSAWTDCVGVPLVVSDTVNNRIYIGSSTPDSTGVLLVADNKNSSGDPTGVEGGMYYNSNLGKFRCYEKETDTTGFWRDCMQSARTSFYYMNDYVTTAGDSVSLTSTSNGSFTATAGSTGHPGIVTLDTQTSSSTANARVGSNDAGSAYRLGGGDYWRWETVLRMPTLSDGTNTYTVQAGFNEGNGIGNPVDGCYFKYSNGVNAGEWQGVCYSNNATSTCDTNVVVAANTFYRLTVVVNSAGTSVDYQVDGVSRCQVTSNIPTGAGRETSWNVAIAKSLGLASRTLELDYVEVMGQLGTPR